MVASCTYQENNTIKQADSREGCSRVYGAGKDSLPAQLNKKYTADPNLEKRATAIREKLLKEYH